MTAPEASGLISAQEKVRAVFCTFGAVFLADSDSKVPGLTVTSNPASAVIKTGSPPVGGVTGGGALSGQVLDGVGAGKRPNEILARLYNLIPLQLHTWPRR